MKIKYAIDNLIDIIDGACNCYMLAYIVVCIITITDQKVVPFGVLKDWVNVGTMLALTGMIFIPSKDQRKEMKQKGNK